MRLTRPSSRSRRIGVAFDGDRMIAVLPSQAERWTRMLAPAPDVGPWTDLEAAFRELKERAGEHCRQLFVALMPPLGRIRLIDLPGVKEDEAAQVVRRDPSRFFPVRGEKLVVEVDGAGGRRSSPFVVAAAPARIVQAIALAAMESGWSLGGIVPAQLAWAALAEGTAPQDLAIQCTTGIELLRSHRRRLVSARRIRSSDVVASGAQQQTTPLVIGSPAEAAERAAALAPYAVGPVLQSDLERAAVSRVNRRRAVIRFTVAAAIIIVAAGLELFGVEQQRARVAFERRRISAEVAQSIATRESIAVLTDRLAALRASDAKSPRWAELIAALADELPSDAYLVALTAEGDSLHLEGAATRAAPVFDAMNAMSSVRNVRPEGPIRQELGGAASAEHFLLSASVVRAAQAVRTDHAPEVGAAGGRP